MTDTVTIRLSRNEVVSENIDIALLRLDKFHHSVGQPVTVLYYKEDGNIDTITAIGIKDGSGKDCYSILSTSGELVVNKVISDSIIDIAAIVNGEVYVGKLDGVWYFVSIGEGGEKILEEIKDQTIIKELSSGYRWFYLGGELTREDDFLSQSKIDTLLYRSLNTIYKPEIAVENIIAEKGKTVSNPSFNVEITNYQKENINNLSKITVKNAAGIEYEHSDIISDKVIVIGDFSDTTEFIFSAEVDLGDEKEPIITGSRRAKLEFIYPTYVDYTENATSPINTDNSYLWNGQDKFKVDEISSVGFLRFSVPEKYSIVKILDGTNTNYTESFDILEIEIGDVLYRSYCATEPIFTNSLTFVSENYSSGFSDYDKDLLSSEITDKVLSIVEPVKADLNELKEKSEELETTTTEQGDLLQNLQSMIQTLQELVSSMEQPITVLSKEEWKNLKDSGNVKPGTLYGIIEDEEEPGGEDDPTPGEITQLIEIDENGEIMTIFSSDNIYNPEQETLEISGEYDEENETLTIINSSSKPQENKDQVEISGDSLIINSTNNSIENETITIIGEYNETDSVLTITA